MNEPAKVVTPTSNTVKPAHNSINMVGMKCGRLTVICPAPTHKNRGRWNCICECGQGGIFLGSNLRRGKSKSCGCLAIETGRLFNTTHGKRQTREYRIWTHIKTRCSNPKCLDFPRYGGRGIAVCDRWKNSFQNFFEDMGVAPRGFSIERIDNLLGYSPENCRWANHTDQANNTRRNTIIEVEGIRLTISEWAKKSGIKAATISARIRYGIEPQKAVTTLGRLNHRRLKIFNH